MLDKEIDTPNVISLKDINTVKHDSCLSKPSMLTKNHHLSNLSVKLETPRKEVPRQKSKVIFSVKKNKARASHDTTRQHLHRGSHDTNGDNEKSLKMIQINKID